MFDIGSIYYLGYGSVRIATSLSNFGCQLKPSGTYVSPYTGERRSYDGFDSPTMFRYGLRSSRSTAQDATMATSLRPIVFQRTLLIVLF